MSNSSSSPNDNDYLPSATWSVLQTRAELLAKVRQFFVERDFLEVETPVLSQDIVIDRHLDPFVTKWSADPRQDVQQQQSNPNHADNYWLQTSPEFAMKRLLAAGAGPIFQIAKVFRNGERGMLHNPEFTMIEWYRPGDDYATGIELLSEFARFMFGHSIVRKVTYRDVFLERFQINPHLVTVEELAAVAELNNLVAPASLLDDRDGWLDFLFTEAIQNTLGRAAPTILCDYPASQSALAKLRSEQDAESFGQQSAQGEYQVAERFELFFEGVELANGYHELLDPSILRVRNELNNRARRADGKEKLPSKSRLLKAMEHGLPACAGCALGFDRLVMLITGAKEISEVLAFPWERA